MRKKRPWKLNKKGTEYIGTYARDRNGDRRFDLIPTVKDNKVKSFESPKAAIKLGWAQV